METKGTNTNADHLRPSLKTFVTNAEPRVAEIAKNNYAKKITLFLKKVPELKNKNLSSQNNNYFKTANFQTPHSRYIGGRGESNVKEGFGVQIWSNGTKYTGYFHNNKANGLGIFLHSEGSKYLGSFVEDKQEGYGIYTHSNGSTYNGYWKQESQEGVGIEIWKDGSQYQGEYLQGKKHGLGTYVWLDGSKYEGEWKGNNLEGYGIYYFNDGRLYQGEWKNNMMNGFGAFYWKDGKKYIGQYLNDKKDGFGAYEWENPEKIYIGFWKEGKQHGPGMYVDERKVRYSIWNNGKRIKWFEDSEEIFSFFDKRQIVFSSFFKMDFQKINKILLKFQREIDN